MKKKTGKALYAFLVIFALMLATTLFACGEEKVKPIPEGPETGTYYYYTDAGDYIVTLSDGNKFSLILGDGAKFGTYTADGTKLSFTFAKEEDGTATATIANNEVLTLTYKNSEMIFRRNTQYTVTFDTGSGSSVAAATVTNGKAISRPADPTLAGHRFIGWYTDTSYSAPYVFDITPVTSDITLYAQWGKVTPGQSEFEIKFDSNGADVAYPNMQTIGGKLYDAPAPVREGYEFKGWWIGESADKLFALVTKDTEFKENSTLYALWQSTSSTGKLPAPIITVGDNKITWDGIAGATGYDWEVLDGSGKKIGGARISGTSADFAFAEQAAGEYTVKVTAVSSVSANSATATVYYKHKVLDKVSRFEVVEPSVLLFNAVANADAYYITVKCGDAEHSHESVLLGKNTSYNFSNCAMKEGGIEFTVTAVADGYASSESGLYSYERKLAEIDEIYVDEATQTVHWSSVPNATNYLVTVDCGNADHSHIAVNNGNKTSYCVKECENKDGKIQISVKPVSKGYNSPETVKTVSYNKKSLATPGNIVVNGSVVSWNEVNGATGYTLSVDGKTFTVTGESYDLNKAGITWSQEKDYVINVQANGAADSLWSDDVSVRYNSMSGALSYEDGKINWRGVLGATNYQIKLNNVIIGTVESGNTSAEIKFTKAGVNTVSVRSMGANGYSDWVSVDVFAYEIAFDSRMGSGADPNSLFLAVGDSIELPSSQRAGFELSGWYNAPSGNSSKFEDTVFTSAANMTLYAYWTPATFRVTYDFDGGSSDKTGKDVKYSQQYTLDVPVPDDTSTAFLGWFTAAGSDGARLTDEKGNCLSQSGWDYTEDRTVYAHWARVFSFTELPGGAGYAVMKAEFGDMNSFSEITVPVTYNNKPVTVVEAYAFRSCSTLVKINIPDTVEIIETATAFSGCTRLAEVSIYHVEGNSDIAYFSEEGMLVHKNEVTGENDLVFVPKSKTGSVTVPYGVTNIMLDVFNGASISEIVIPSTVTYIERNAFYDCANLTKVTFLPAALGEAVQPLELSERAFVSCANLKEIVLPARLKSFSSDMFTYCGSITDIDIEKGGVLSSSDGMLVDGTTLVYCPVGRVGSVTVPNGITAVGANAFNGCTKITEIIIPNFVTKIENYAFGGCSKVTSVTFKGGAISDLEIGNYAFQNCYRLKNVVFESGSKVKKIGNSAFNGCNTLASFTFPASLTEVGSSAFEGCINLRSISFAENGADIKFGSNAFKNCKSLRTINFPSTVTKIDDNLLDGCDNLATVNVDPANPNYASVDGVLFDKNITEILFYPKAKGNYTDMPSTVTTIGANVFRKRTNITSFTVGTNITLIKSGAFAECTSLKEVIFTPGGTEELIIEDGAGLYDFTGALGVFHKCTLLTEVRLPERLKSVPAYLFNGCSALTSAPIPSEAVSIGNYAFNECVSLREAIIPSKVKTIGDKAFAGKSGASALTQVEIPEGVTSIGSGAFQYCISLTHITLPGTLTSIGGGAFQYCSALINVTFNDISGTNEDGTPATLTIGSNYLFSSCSSLQSVTLPEGLTNLPGYTFSSCKKLEEITVPSTVTSIGANWNGSCYALKKVTFAVIEGETPKPFDSLPTSSYGSLFGSLTNLTTVENLGKRISEIPNYAFNGCSALTSIDLTGVTKIGTCAFQNSGLTSINIPDTVTVIGDNAFNGCAALTALTHFSDKVTVIDNNTFKGTGLASISIPKSVVTIGTGAFNGSKLTSVDFESGRTEALTMKEGSSPSDGAFASCAELLTVSNIPASLTVLPAYTFDNCAKLTSVTFEKGGTQGLAVNDSAFKGSAANFVSITLPARTSSVHAKAFTDKSALASINIDTEDALYTGAKVMKSEDGILYSVDDKGNPNTLVMVPKGKSGTVTVPNTVSQIADSAFNGCSLVTAVVFASGGSAGLSIGTDEATSSTGVFMGSGITSISLPARTVSIGKYAFAASSSSNAKITSVTFETEIPSAQPTTDGETQPAASSRLDKIGDYAFQYAKITSVSVPLSVSTIGSNAFNGCSLLEEITISGKFKDLSSIFTGCNAVTKYVIQDASGALVKSIDGIVFNLAETELIAYPVGKTETVYTVPDTITSVAAKAFAGNTYLTSVIFPASVTDIGANAFSGCTALNSVRFDAPASGNGADLTIGAEAFKGTALSALTVPARTVSIGGNAFNGISSLKTLVFADNGKNITFGNSVFASTGITSIDFGDNCSIETLSTNMFYNCKSLASAELPESITAVGDFAFQNCETLQSITFGTALKSIGNSAFSGCKILKNITLPSSLTSIGSSAFQNCKELTSLAIPEGVTSIGSTAFSGSGITEITIPGSLKTIPDKMFKGCDSLVTVILSEGITRIDDGYYYWGSYDTSPFKNCTSIKEVRLPSTLEYIGKAAFYGCGITEITIPSNVTTIEEYAFYNCFWLKNVRFEEHSMLDKLGKYTFYGCSELVSVGFTSDALEEIPTYAFATCPKLASVTLPSSLTKIGSNAFATCPALTGINLPSTVASIGSSAFTGSGLTSVIIPAGVTEIQNYTFSGCASLSEVIIPSTVDSIGGNAFYGCSSLASIELPAGLSSLGDSVFTNSGLESIVIPNGVASIGGSAFSGCTSLEAVEIGNGVVSLGRQAFMNCSTLETLTLPDSLTSIGAEAFSGCTSLKSYSLSGESMAYAVEEGVIYDIDKTAIVAFPSGKTGEIIIPNTVTTVGNYAFAGAVIDKVTFQTGLKSMGDYAFSGAQTKTVILPEGLETIGRNAFAHSGITSITIPESVLTVGSYLFYQSALEEITILAPLNHLAGNMFNGCASLTKVTLPEGLQNLGDPSDINTNTFGSCTSLESITIPSTVTSIGDYDFSYCTGIKSITIPSSVRTIKKYAFYNSGLTSITIPETVESVGISVFESCADLTSAAINISTVSDEMFKNCANLKSVTLAEDTVELKDAVFNGCAKLSSLVLPETLNYIGSETFLGCKSLSSLTVPASIKYVGGEAFSGWTESQHINFCCPESASDSWEEASFFTEGWRGGCEAQITWDYAA